MTKRNKTPIIITAIVLAATVLIVASLVYAFGTPLGNNADNNQSTPAPSEIIEPGVDDEAAETEAEPQEEAEVTIDPATTSTIDVEPLGIKVAYVTGIPGFSYAVSQTGGSTGFVEFNAEELAGTKCTDDKGLFASIIKDPAQADLATIQHTTKVQDVTYGLSLSAPNCTGDTALFDQYQASFRDAFGLLSAL